MNCKEIPATIIDNNHIHCLYKKTHFLISLQKLSIYYPKANENDLFDTPQFSHVNTAMEIDSPRFRGLSAMSMMADNEHMRMVNDQQLM